MTSTLTKALLVACLAVPALASAKTDTKTFQGNDSVETINFSIAALSTVSINYSWSDMLLTQRGHDSIENDATSLTWTLLGKIGGSGPYTSIASGSFSDAATVFDGSGVLALGDLAAGKYKLSLQGSWDAVALTGDHYELSHWSKTGGKVNLVEGSLAFAAPVPEPESYAMFAAGLGLMGFIARRRSKA